MCGEKPVRRFPALGCKGSPPHVRGKAQKQKCVKMCVRITPACAGKSVTSSIKKSLDSGSPPHVRGKVYRAGYNRNAAGDHPRMCGEKYQKAQCVLNSVGSPPHVRGKAHSNYYTTLPPGITPACAGKSPFFSDAMPVARDHPRMCGEKFQDTLGGRPYLGSPPHVRGKD